MNDGLSAVLEEDTQAREIVRQAALPDAPLGVVGSGQALAPVLAEGSRTMATSVSGGGRTKLLFVVDSDPLDEPAFYLGDDAIEDM